MTERPLLLVYAFLNFRILFQDFECFSWKLLLFTLLLRAFFEQLNSIYIKFGEYLVGNTVKDENGKEIQLPKEQQDFTMKYVKKLPFAVQQVKQMYDPREYAQYLIDCCKSSGSNLLMLEQMIIHHSQRRIAVMDKVLEGITKNTIVFQYFNCIITNFKFT